MIPLIVAVLWLIVHLVVIWGGAYILKVIVDWVPFIPAPIKTIMWYVIVAGAIVLSIIACIGLLTGNPFFAA